MQDKVTETQVAIIGGGIIGAAIARELSKYKVDVCLLEKEPGIGFGITKGSLGLLHSALGLSASKLVKWWDRSGDAKAYLSKPLRKKERLNITGRQMFLDLAPQLGAAIHKCGRIMVAKDEAELRILEIMRQVAEEKTGTRLDLLDKKGLQEKEPEIDSKFIGGLYDPYEYSVFPTEWAIAFAENARENGVHILLETEISAIEERKDQFKLKTNHGSIGAQFVINSAGLFSDDIAKMIDRIDWSFVLWKSQLMIIENKGYLRHILSEVLTPQLPRIMVPTPEGNIEVGVIMSKGDSKYDLSNTKEGIDLMLSYPQFYIPRVSVKKDVIKYFVGYMHFNSRNPDDYLIEWPRNRFLNLIACAPGIGPAPAIAAEIVEMLGQRGLPLDLRGDFNPYRFKEPRFIDLPSEAKNEKIQSDARYGHIVCRCEKISEKEIRDAVRSGLRTLDGVKFATWAGMGRCQGGFCTSRVLKIMSEELGVPVTLLKQRGGDSLVVQGTTKPLLQGTSAGDSGDEAC